MEALTSNSLLAARARTQSLLVNADLPPGLNFSSRRERPPTMAPSWSMTAYAAFLFSIAWTWTMTSTITVESGTPDHFDICSRADTSGRWPMYSLAPRRRTCRRRWPPSPMLRCVASEPNLRIFLEQRDELGGTCDEHRRKASRCLLHA